MAAIDVKKAFKESEKRNNVGSETFQEVSTDLVALFKNIKECLKENDANYEFEVECKFEDFGTIGSGLRQHVGQFNIAFREGEKDLTSFSIELQSDVAWKENKPSKVQVLMRFKDFDERAADLFKSEIYNRSQGHGTQAGKWRETHQGPKSYEYLLQSGFYKPRSAQSLSEDMQQRIVDMVYALSESLDADAEHGPKPPERISEAGFGAPMSGLRKS